MTRTQKSLVAMESRYVKERLIDSYCSTEVFTQLRTTDSLSSWWKCTHCLRLFSSGYVVGWIYTSRTSISYLVSNNDTNQKVLNIDLGFNAVRSYRRERLQTRTKRARQIKINPWFHLTACLGLPGFGRSVVYFLTVTIVVDRSLALPGGCLTRPSAPKRETKAFR